jgi:glucose-1-phosphate cytidylyltransferase
VRGHEVLVTETHSPTSVHQVVRDGSQWCWRRKQPGLLEHERHVLLLQRNIGERLWAVRDQVKDEDMFLANYSDGLSDVDLDAMVADFKASGKIACFLAVRPAVTFHLAEIANSRQVTGMRSVERSDLWINGGFFIFRREIFDYMRPGEELVVEPFARLIEEGQLLAYKHTGFWRSMDTLRDRQVLEEMVERGDMPWNRQETMACRVAAE